MKRWLSVHIDEEQLDTVVDCLIEMLNMSEDQFFIEDENQPLDEDNIEKIK